MLVYKHSNTAKDNTMEKFIAAAEANIDRNLADAVADDLDSIQENMYILAHDGAVDAGASMEQATQIATQLSSM
jgi:hypothetical protein